LEPEALDLLPLLRVEADLEVTPRLIALHLRAAVLEVVIMMARWLVVPVAERHIFAVEAQARQGKAMLVEMARPVGE
jgi:hypothetical protein